MGKRRKIRKERRGKIADLIKNFFLSSEVLPDKDPSNITAIAGAALTQDILYLMYESKRNR